MDRSDLNTLIHRGRKAGLGAAELYQAPAAHRLDARERRSGEPDGNGFALSYAANGQRTYRPPDRPARP